MDEAGLSDRVDFIQTTLEDLDEQDKYDVVYINISMHEARDIDLATKNVRNALIPGGHFVISDFRSRTITRVCEQFRPGL